LDKIRRVGQCTYQSPEAVDPYSGYRDKACPGFFHTVRPVIKDCVPVDDLVFPSIYREEAPDGFWILHDIDGIGLGTSGARLSSTISLRWVPASPGLRRSSSARQSES